MSDDEMRDVIEEVKDEEKNASGEGVAPDDDFAEADASAGESDDEDDQEEFAEEDEDVEVRVIRNSGNLGKPCVSRSSFVAGSFCGDDMIN